MPRFPCLFKTAWLHDLYPFTTCAKDSARLTTFWWSGRSSSNGHCYSDCRSIGQGPTKPSHGKTLTQKTHKTHHCSEHLHIVSWDSSIRIRKATPASHYQCVHPFLCCTNWKTETNLTVGTLGALGLQLIWEQWPSWPEVPAISLAPRKPRY